MQGGILPLKLGAPAQLVTDRLRTRGASHFGLGSGISSRLGMGNGNGMVMVMVWARLKSRLLGLSSAYGSKLGLTRLGSAQDTVRLGSGVGDRIGAHCPDRNSGLGSARLEARLGEGPREAQFGAGAIGLGSSRQEGQLGLGSGVYLGLPRSSVLLGSRLYSVQLGPWISSN